MDSFTNPFLTSIWSHNNNTSDKTYSEDGLDPPVVIPNSEEDIVSSSLLVTNSTNGQMKLNAGSSIVPSTRLVEGGSGCELTDMPPAPLVGTELFPSNPAIWVPSSFPNRDASSFKDLGEFHNSTPNSFGNVQQLASFNGLNGVTGLNLTTFASGSHVSFTQTLQLAQQANAQLSSGNHQLNQTPTSQVPTAQVTSANNAGFDGTLKPRARARRGQATDPHSIAERLRREKISERMKNLQELVPNSNKTDKASMLDEIIEYVKFLQLQVKVLSMSRLGATEAVVPLLTESQPEGSNGVLSSVSVGSTANNSVDGTAEVQDSEAFEREVVQLMESNMTSAMQYLQNKGLCLMPIALASAISTQKGTRVSAIPAERQNPGSVLSVASSLCNDLRE